MSSPHDTPFEIVHDGRSDSGASQWNGADYVWQPGNITDDPHDDFEGDDFDLGTVAPNILT